MSAHLSICQRAMPWGTGTRNVNVQLSSFFLNLRNDQIIEYVEERVLLMKE